MTDTRPAPSTGLRMAIDWGPLAVFFAVNFLTPGEPIARIVAATSAFMIAIVIAMIVSRVKTGHISPALWVGGVFVLLFGGLTLYFHDSTFIKMKPTVVYTMFAAILAFGLATGRPLLQALLGTAYPGLSAEGWRKLTRNWALFFVFMAVLNEIVWRTVAPHPDSDLTTWAAFKLWGAIPLTLVFAMANVPMLMRHGLTLGEDAPPVPPEA